MNNDKLSSQSSIGPAHEPQKAMPVTSGSFINSHKLAKKQYTHYDVGHQG